MIDSKIRPRVQKIFNRIAAPLIKRGVKPTSITLAAAVIGLIAALLLALSTSLGLPARIGAFVLLWLSGLLDVLDGTVARATGTSSALGAFLDLILDRVVEAALLLGLVASGPPEDRLTLAWTGMVFLILIIINFSAFLLAGSLFPNTGEKSLYYEGGITERTETMIVFALAILLPAATLWLLWIFIALMAWTAFGRFRAVIRFVGKNKQKDPT